MSKIVAIITFFGIAILMIGIFWYGRNQNPPIDDIDKYIGLAGSLLSLGGVLMALVQIKQADEQIKLSATQIQTVAQTTEKIKEAVAENKQEIRDFLSMSEVAHLVESIRYAQLHVRQKAYSNAALLLQMIKDDMIRANHQYSDVIASLKLDVPDTITKLNLDIETLTMNGLYKAKDIGSKHTLKPEIIHQNLEAAREIFIEIETSLKQKKI
ncbi:MAG: hypothetical protein K2L17_11020 [Muribaculaceae bacterium]|nr:hypothetical protein [Muribaculaceae bacterium]